MSLTFLMCFNVFAANSENIILSAQKLYLNGKPLNINTYNIDGYNYILNADYEALTKQREISNPSALLNNLGSLNKDRTIAKNMNHLAMWGFEIKWNKDTNSVDIIDEWAAQDEALKQEWINKDKSWGQEVATSWSIEIADKVANMIIADKITPFPWTNEWLVDTVSENIDSNKKILIDLVNEVRVKAGLNALQVHDGLMNAAQVKADEMATLNYYSHNSPNWGNPTEQARKMNIGLSIVCENLVQGRPDALWAFQAWMNSKGHRNTILNENEWSIVKYKYIGIGIGTNKDSDGKNYWALMLS